MQRCNGMSEKYVVCVVRFISGYDGIFTWIEGTLFVVRNKWKLYGVRKG